ncbi:uncharacterized protein SCHCODRAFT_02634991 [Schizophyllum commune H4-8]|nr:uncharacterized protein SCHCODRAFT_02634991 [Schizophyllum commune H4-8]KAI5889585.1 hypothetical protein SCHCODRAFT_02634991 [Schizophyllum commune H4-8]
MQPSSSNQHAYPSGLTPGAQEDASVGASRGKFRFKLFKLRKSRAKTVPPQTPQQTASLPSPVATPAPILDPQRDVSLRFSVSPTPISLPSPTWNRDLSQAPLTTRTRKRYTFSKDHA